FNDAMPQAYTSDYQDLGLLDRDEWPMFTGCFYNRIFLNIAATRLVAGRALAGSADAIEQRYLGGAMAPTPKPPLRERLPQWKYRLRSAPKLISMFLTLQKSAEKAERRVMALEPKVYALDPATLSDERFERIRVKLAKLGVDVAKVHLRVTAAAGQGFDTVDRLVRPILGDETDGRLPVLFTGLQGVESAQISLDLWELSRVAVREGLADRLRADDFDPWQEANPAWHTAFRAFIDRHGHRGLNEMELAARTWRTDPGPAMAVVKSFLDLSEEQSPQATLERQKAERLELTRELESKMNPARRGVFRWALKDAQRWVSLRERTKSVLVREARWVDHFTPELQRRLVERDLIDQPDDLFFLTTGEVTEVLTGHAADDYRDRVIRRRREYERNRHVMLPERFRGRPVPLSPDEAGHSGDVLTGTPVSAGAVTGRARVILDPRVDREFAPGEILVAPVTDAGWTPLFALASGLVVDMGSALSHGSTVAREYGLPAVVNVRHATRLIRTGDLIAVNGTKGTVTIVESAG
ncbi:MAG: PEP-utilizing enzyme, partial [Hyphomicrobiales bacterium]